MGLKHYSSPPRAAVAGCVAGILTIILGSLQPAYGQIAQPFNIGRRALPATAFPNILPTMDPAYAGSFTAIDLGVAPVSIAADIGALTFRDANTLLIDVNTFQPNAELDAVTVVRGADQHITGFAAVGTKVADAPYVDGGLQFGFDGVLFYTAFGPNQLVEFKPGSTTPDKYIDLTPLGVGSSVGSLGFVPPGFPGQGGLKLISWDAKTWYSTFISPDGLGTFNISPPTALALPSVNWEALAFIKAGQPLFSVNSVIIVADLVNAVYVFQLDSSSNPITSTQKHFMDVSDPVGMTVDPVTGDLLITTEQGPMAGHISLVRGFSPTTAPPAPTITTTKNAYSLGETVVVNFSNASGNAHDWIGLYASGALNTAYSQWFFTDGTQTTGTAGLVNGSVSFPGGFSTAGTYEARLFFGDFIMQDNVVFTVQNGPPAQPTNPNPAAGAAGVNFTPILSWTAGAGAASHNVYFGTTSSLGTGQFKGNQSTTSFAPGTLSPQTIYYWRVDEVNGQGTTTGPVWSFTTANPPPSLSTSKPTYTTAEAVVVNFSNAPGNTKDWIALFASGAANSAFLQWLYTDGTQTGTPGKINGSVTFASGLASAGSYEARLFSNDSFTLLATAAFSVQSGPPGQATNPNPASSSTGVSATPTLSWTAGTGASSHNVYFGTNPSPGAAELKGNQAGVTYVPGTLASQTKYYWRIDEINGQGTTTGVVWSFTTAAVPALTTSKPTYNLGEGIVVNFFNAPGNAHDWIGLYASGAANSALLQWIYTDGTQTGTAGEINGSVTFSSGLASPGSYEARLFSNDTFALQATVGFSVQSGPPGQASNPNPSSGSTGVSSTPTLSWAAGTGAASHNVYFGTNPNPGAAELKGNQAGATYAPGTLPQQTTFYWRIDELNGSGTTAGVVWSFTTAAAPMVTTSKSSYSPGEGITVNFFNASGNAHDWIGLYAAGAPNTNHLAWAYTDGTQSGTAGLINGTVLFPTGLATGGSYEARLFFNDSFVLAASVTFSVQSSLPGQANNPNPSANATGVSLTPTLSWTAGSGTASHQVYLGTSSTLVSGNLVSSQTATTFAPGQLTAQTTYFWRIDEVNGSGTTTGVVWSFTTTVAPAGQATNPSPANKATNVSRSSTLSWTAGSGTTTNNVYFGTTSTLGSGQLKSTQTGTSYSPGALGSRTAYFWRIDEMNAQGTTTGVVWSFTTGKN